MAIKSLHFKFLTITAFSLVVFFLAPSAHAATLYYNNAQGDGEWTDLGNWWQNSADTIAATAIPTTTDDVVIQANVFSNLDDPAMVNSAVLENGASWDSSQIGLTLIVSDDVIFGANQSTAYNFGFIIGTTTFNYGSYNDGGTITGTSTFNNNSYNQGVLIDNVVFNDTSFNLGTVTGNAVFNDTSYNYGAVTGTSTFTDATGGVMTIPDTGEWGSGTSGVNVGSDDQPITSWVFDGDSSNHGTITEATFNDTSTNANTITGDATFNDLASNAGNVIGTSTFSYATGGVITIPNGGQWGGTSGSIVGIDDNPITSWIFDGSSENYSTTTGNATFNDTSFNLGTVTGDATFNNEGVNAGIVDGIAKFTYATGGVITIPAGEDAVWGNGTAGSIVGNDNNPITSWVFDGNSQNQGTVTGNAIFNDNSENNGTVSSNAVFNDMSFNFGTVTGTSTFSYATGGVITIPNYGHWGSGTSGSIVGADNEPITSWVFDGNSTNIGTVTGNAIFNDGSLNYGTVTGNAVFNGASINYSAVTGDAVFNDLASNAGNVIGTSTFSYATGGVITIPNGGQWGNGTSGANVGIDDQPITSWVFDGNSINWGTVTGNATFNDRSSNEVTVTGIAMFTYATGGVITISTGGAWGGGSAGSNVDREGNPIISWIFDDNSHNHGTIMGDVVFYGDLSQSGTVFGSSTRIYTQNATTTQNFTADGPWTVIANGAIVNISQATYDDTTIFQTENGGQFITTPYTVIAPTISTNAATSVSTSSATLNAYVSSIGNQDLYGEGGFYGFAYGTSSDLISSAATTSVYQQTGIGIDGPAPFILALTSLVPNTTYYFRAYATNPGSYPLNAYGSILSFYTGTQASPPPSGGGGGTSISQTSSGGGGSSYIPPVVSSSTPSVPGCPIGFTCKPVPVPGCPTGFTCAPASTPTYVTTPSSDLTLGDTGSDVTALQNFLIAQGDLAPQYNTGYFGPLTQTALAKYQSANGISPASGYYGPKTRAFMEGNTPTTPTTPSFTRDLTLGSTGSDVTALQNFLIAQGDLAPQYNTGYFGPLTQTALAKYQAANGISPAVGYFGVKTRGYIEPLIFLIESRRDFYEALERKNLEWSFDFASQFIPKATRICRFYAL